MGWTSRCSIAVACLLGLLALTPRSAAAQPSAPRLTMGSDVQSTDPSRDGYYHGERPISVEEFLRIAGHPEKAHAMKGRKRVRLGIAAAGAVLVASAFVVTLTARECGPGLLPAERRECDAERHRSFLLATGIGGAGAATFGIAIVLSSKRPPLHELRRMTVDYNRRLEVVPAVGAAGGGISLRGRF